ncbi:CHAT domain-containing protein [Streptomyces sp. NPDC005474]|uniref:CHAT domain-containing protein n=1 Tax=Streptomyces sp. NPDC005474 TaxID=3154878 RepID=UPI003456B164
MATEDERVEVLRRKLGRALEADEDNLVAPSVGRRLAELEELMRRRGPARGAGPGALAATVATARWRRCLLLPTEPAARELDTAIRMFRQSVAALNRRHPDRAALLTDLGLALRTRYEWREDPQDLDGAVRAGRASTRATPADHPDRALHLSTLANSLHTRFERSGDPADIDETVRCAAAAVRAAPEPHPDRALYLSNLGNALRARFERTGEPGDLDEAIRAGRAALEHAPPGDPDRPMFSGNLGLALRVRYEQTSDAAALDEAIALARICVRDTDGAEVHHAMYLSNLGGALRTRYDRGGSPTDLDEAIDLARTAVDTARDDDPDTAMYWSNHGLALRTRYERVGSAVDLDEAVRASRAAVEATRGDGPEVAMYLSNLGLALRTRHEHSGSTTDLDEAVRVTRASVERTPDDHPDRTLYLANLATALRVRYERAADPNDLDEAVRAGRTAAAADTTVQRADRAFRKSALGMALRLRFELTGDEEVLDEAVRTERSAVSDAPADQPQRAGYLANLALTLRVRYERTLVRRDLEEAVTAAREATRLTTPDNPGHASCLDTLGTSLQMLFELTGDQSWLREALRSGRAAVRHTPVDHLDRPMYLSNYGLALQLSYEKGRSERDGLSAVEMAREAVATSGAGDPNRPAYLCNLALALQSRFDTSADTAALDEAIAVARTAVAAVPVSHPDHGIYLGNLGTMLDARYERDGAPRDRHEAVKYAREAAENPTTPLDTRIGSAHQWGRRAWEAGDVREAGRGYGAAVALLPALVWQGLDRATQEQALARWSGLVSDAVAATVAAGAPSRAVELAEQGRSLLWAQTLRLRGDLTRLTEVSPELSRRMSELRQQLDHPAAWSNRRTASGARGDALLGEALEQRRRLARAWDELVDRIRSLDGFERFLAPTPFDELRAAAHDGAVVIVNSSRLGCSALLLTPDDRQPRVVPLPDLDHAEALRRANLCLAITTGGPRDGHTGPLDERVAMLDVLDWLWTTVGRPVLHALGHTGVPGATWPRIWWCPVGAMAFLPLHAASARESAGPDDSVLARVVSSYIPTLGALLRARGGPRDPRVELLVVALPHTPGLSRLPAVPREVAALARRVRPPARAVYVTGEQATHQAIQTHLPDFPWVHLACHAAQNGENLAESAFFPWDWQQHPLTIAELVDLRLSRAELAFLSACQTSAGSARLTEESVHLAAAMQVSGYRHVIATLWPTVDPVTPRLVDLVYDGLLGEGRADSDRASEALHHAVTAIRARYPDDPRGWACYIHLGA